MYLELFKLHELPFRLSPDPQFLYLSKQHARAKAYMESTIWFTDGFVVITGDIGAGKTTLIETFLRELQADVVVAQINQTQLSPTAFLQTVLVQFGFTPFDMKKPEVLATLNQFLTEQYASGRKVLLIVDEAQNLSNRVLEEIRMLSGVETTKEKVLRIILAGQPELNEKLNSSEPHPTDAARTSSVSFNRAHGGGNERLYRSPARSGRLAGPANFCCGDLSGNIQIHGRRAALDQHLVRHLHDGRVRQGQRHRRRCRTSTPPFVNCSGSIRPPARIACKCLPTWSRRWPPQVVRRCRWRPRPCGDRASRSGAFCSRAQARPSWSASSNRAGWSSAAPTDNDLQIDSKFISRHHCQIVTQPDSCLIEDLNSTNGIYVQSKRVRRHNLNDGDVVQVGQHEIMYIDERTPRLRSTVDPGETEVIDKR